MAARKEPIVETFTWQLVGFSSATATVLSERFGAFPAAGAWQIQAYPQGDRQESKDHLSLYLNYCSPASAPTAEATGVFTLKHPSGVEQRDLWRALRKDHFGSKALGWGWTKFITLEELRSKGLLHEGDKLVIQVEVTITTCCGWVASVDANTAQDTLALPAAAASEASPGKFASSMFNNERFSDCTIVVPACTDDAGQQQAELRLACHRIVLAAGSKVLDTLMSDRWQQTPPGGEARPALTLVEAEPPLVQVMFKWMYGLEVTTLNMAQLVRLWGLADKYDVPVLRLAIEDMLCKAVEAAYPSCIWLLYPAAKHLNAAGQLAQRLWAIATKTSDRAAQLLIHGEHALTDAEDVVRALQALGKAEPFILTKSLLAALGWAAGEDTAGQREQHVPAILKAIELARLSFQQLQQIRERMSQSFSSNAQVMVDALITLMQAYEAKHAQAK